MSFQVTAVTASDIPRLIDIYYAAFEGHITTILFRDTKRNRERWVEELQESIEDPEQLILKATEGIGASEEVIGWCQWELWKAEDFESNSETGSDSDDDSSWGS
ncbi:hypothetical protein IWW34DRAFT_753528 [Fusarium oxysporum f. sp. albedinis]|nr:hypothetical protein IWW34DRAFT_753528 [Fusarium oxysporum f. sp. albedinis]KAK2471177.1 hypothetical protein H9L39_17408 [Fusarium oxysporum f. sp. albedinis]